MELNYDTHVGLSRFIGVIGGTEEQAIEFAEDITNRPYRDITKHDDDWEVAFDTDY